MDYLACRQNVFLIVNDEKPVKQPAVARGIHVVVQDLASKELFETFDLNEDDRVILCFRNAEKLKKCLVPLLSLHDNIPIVLIVPHREDVRDFESHGTVFSISIESLLTQQLSIMWRKAENRKNRDKLNEISNDAGNVLILVQNDPDPDALASGLALRVLLGRNKQTAPIGSFGEVTRSENLNMVKLLDIPVRKIAPDSLQHFSKIALVDVNPAYFKDLDIKADIVIDHHHVSENPDAAFFDIRPSYGATSTIMGQYLIDGNYKITPRLATALVYGIKTDTMFLDRDISPADIEVFTSLYPIVNLNMLRQIEHATLEYGEINGFIKALNNINIFDKILFSYLGKIQQEDIVPRLADFCLQIGRTQWAIVSGIYNENIICSVRNVGYVKHAGEIVDRAFGRIGSAGGHHSMAKAVIPLRKFKKHFGVSLRKEIGGKIIEVFLNTID